MSKRELKKYLSSLKKEQLEDQILDLYGRFKDVKNFYNFVFNPQEEKLLAECKFKISKEYFPVNGRKPKMRRSVAKKYIQQFRQLGVNPLLIADVMLYNIEIAQTFSGERYVRQDAFYISIFKSFEDAFKYINDNGMIHEFSDRFEKAADEAWNQNWLNKSAFARVCGRDNY